MNSDLIQEYESIINNDFLLKREGGTYIIEEEKKEAQNRKFIIQIGRGIGFSLDRNGVNNWSFLSKSPPKGIKSVSDGIIVCEYKGESYIFLIDIKSGNNGNAAKQIKSSFYLCEWMNNLIKLHLNATISYKFIGIICRQRSSIPKGSTKKSKKPFSVEVCSLTNITIFTISNFPSLHASEVIEWLN